MQLLPSTPDLNNLKEDFQILISRIIVKHLKEYSGQSKHIQWHIQHQYSKEISSKSNVVPLGVLFYNETKVDEMCSIMESLQQYVPVKPCAVTETLPNGEDFTYDDFLAHPILLRGDLLTVLRAKGAQLLRSNHENAIDCLDGLLPFAEDWHTRQSLLKAMWKFLFASTSLADQGTLSQIKNLLHRTAVPSDPADNMKGSEDFLLMVLHAHVIAAAKVILSSAQVSTATELAKLIVDRFVTINLTSNVLRDRSSSSCSTATSTESVDGVHLYAKELLSLGLLWHAYHDSVKEGDGDRVLRYWKFLLLVFKVSQCHHYSKEAVRLLLNDLYILSPRQRAQLRWSRFVNTRSQLGCNIAGDLHMEHIIRRIKTVLRNMGPNITNSTIEQAAKSIGMINHVCTVFEHEMARKPISGNHSYPSFEKDFEIVLKVLEDKQVFHQQPGRTHLAIKLGKGLLEKIDLSVLKEWLKKKTREILPNCNIKTS